MSEKAVKSVSPRTESIIKGLFLTLLAVVFALNVGKIGRTLTFLPLYIFGVSYYLLIAFLLFVGAYRILFKRKFKFKKFSIGAGLFLLFLASLLIVPFVFFKVNGMSFNDIKFNELIAQFNGQYSEFYKPGFINVFEPNSFWSLGIIGTLVCGLLQNDLIILVVGVIVFTLALVVLFGQAVVRAFRNMRDYKDAKGKAIRKIRAERRAAEEMEEEEEEEEEITPITRDDIRATHIESFVREIEPEEIKAGYETPREEPVYEDTGFDRVNPSLDQMFGNTPTPKPQMEGYNEFTPLVFNSDSSPFQHIPSMQKVEPQPAPVVKEEVTPVAPIEEEINFIDSRPTEVIPPVKEERQVDENLVKMQPQFEEVKEEPVVTQAEVIQEVKKKKERVVWIPPSSEILATYEIGEALELNERVANERVEALNNILSDFRIGAHISGYTIGPSVTRFNVEYEPNVSSKSVEKYVQDISRRLGGVSSRFAPVVPGESYSGLEVPNATITTVGFKDTVTALPDVKKHPLAVAFGKDISGKVLHADFDEFPHLLVAGTTGSGKSIFVHSIISTLIMRNSPDDLKLVLVDPKRVEMVKYRDMPHLLCPIITEAEKVNVCLRKLVDEMNHRYETFAENGLVSNIKDYNAFVKENGGEPMPYIMVFIDEYADLVDQCKDISMPVVSIAQKARAAGIHMCIATQRPSTNIITGVIKGNIPTHVALMTASYTDSIIIIGEAGAETLLGKGDMLVQSPLVSRSGVTRLQGCYVQNKEIVHIVNYLKEHYETNYDENYLDLVDHSKEPAVNALAPGEVEKESSAEEEAKYQSIKEWVMTQEFVSMSKIQRECSVGFNRAGRFFSRLQKEGVVDVATDGSSKGCRVLVHDDYDYGDVVTSNELIG